MQKIHIIGGPTASGKSGRALAIAQKHAGVIINADALQVYADLPLLTAQPSKAEQAHVPHRLYGIFTAEQTCSAGIWAARAEQEIRAAWAEEKLPIVVGGTGLYLKALIDGFSPMPDVPPALREQIGTRWDALGAEAFHALLAARDPATAARLETNDRQRHIRAFEVLEATGKPLSWWQAQPRVAPFARDLFEIEIVTLPRDELYARCDARFLSMLDAGALDEVRAFKHRYPSMEEDAGAAPAVTQALGFSALSAHLDGALSLADATLQAQQATRNYAKRQNTWFRNQLK